MFLGGDATPFSYLPPTLRTTLHVSARLLPFGSIHTSISLSRQHVQLLFADGPAFLQGLTTEQCTYGTKNRESRHQGHANRQSSQWNGSTHHNDLSQRPSPRYLLFTLRFCPLSNSYVSLLFALPPLLFPKLRIGLPGCPVRASSSPLTMALTPGRYPATLDISVFA